MNPESQNIGLQLTDMRPSEVSTVAAQSSDTHLQDFLSHGKANLCHVFAQPHQYSTLFIS